MLEILDDRHRIGELIERSPDGGGYHSYTQLQVNDFAPSDELRHLFPLHTTGGEAAAEFEIEDSTTYLAEAHLTTFDAGEIKIKREDGFYTISTGESIYLEDELFAKKILQTTLPPSTRRTRPPTWQQFSGYFAISSPVKHERRVFQKVDNDVVFLVMSQEYESKNDSGEVLQIARLERSGDVFIGTRLSLTESLDRRMQDTDGDHLESTVHIDRVQAKTANEVAGNLMQLDRLFSGKVTSFKAETLEYDHMSDILDTLNELEQSAKR